MQQYEFTDGKDDAGIVELIEIFEKYLLTKEHIFLDDEALERILEYYEIRNDEIKAEALVDYAIAQNPYSGEFLARKAEHLFRKKKYNEALEHLDRASIFDAGEIDIYLIRADIYIEQNDIEKAIDILNQALTIADDIEKDAIYAELSDVYEIKEDFDTAFECLEQALHFNPLSEDALHKVSHIVDMTDKYDESVALHLRIIEKEPYAWLAWYNLGRAYAGLSLLEKALEAYEFVMAINEDFDYVYRDAADVYYRLENFTGAIEMFELAQQKSGGFDDYSFRLGLCYERIENYKVARFNYRKAVRIDPYMHEAFFRIGETYRTELRYEIALVNYKKALKLDDINEDYVNTIISIYRIIDRTDEVINYMNWLVNVCPDISTYWLELIAFLYEQEKYEEVLETISEAIIRCGHYSEFFYIESAALHRLGKEKESNAILEQALSIDYARHTILIDIDQVFLFLPAIQNTLQIYKD